MKKILYALLAVIATLSFASCNDDFNEGNDSASQFIGSNTIAFKLEKSGIETRSTDAPPVISWQSFSMGDPIDGMNFFLEETVTRLDEVYYEGPETKGTPVYTENFSTMVGGKFYGLAYSASGTTLSTNPVISDGAFTDDGKGVWKREFASDPFATNETLYFFLRSQQSPAGMSNLTYSLNDNGRSVIDFDYESPLTATEQEDIVFGGRPVTKDEASEYVPILFHHVLTGVKFAIANDNSRDVKTYITKVEFPVQMQRRIHFKITTDYENGSNGKWVDDPDYHSSATAVSYTYPNGSQLNSSESFSQEFSESDFVEEYAVGGSFGDKGKYPDSFAAAGNENNLNDATASKTFWFVPQRMNNQVVMDVTFHVISAGKDSGPITRRIPIGRYLIENGRITWRAGELRTYTLKAEFLDVDITDEISGFEKTNVVITNTGNVDAFIRAHITANWFGYAGSQYSAAVGYKGEASSEFVDAWRIDGTIGDNYGGVFEGLPGSGWTQGADGFFYFKQVVHPGKQVPSALFTKYSLNTTAHPVPEIWYLDSKSKRHAFTDVELVMEIPVQAIEVPDGKTWKQAWEAQGVTGLPND